MAAIRADAGAPVHTPRSQLPSMREVRKSLRIKWYRSPIEKEALWELMERSDRKAFMQVFGQLGLSTLLGAIAVYFFIEQQWALFGVFFWIFANTKGFIGSGNHELGHGTVFRTPALNRFFLRVTSTLTFWNYNEYRMSHTYHHRYTLFSDGDRELCMPKNPTLHPLMLLEMFTFNVRGMARVVRSTLRMATGRFDMNVLCSIGGQGTTAWTQALSEVHPETYRAAVRWARFLLFFHGAVMVLSIVFQIWWPAIMLTGSIWTAQWYRYFVGQTQHAGLRENVPDFRIATRSIRVDPFTSFLYWHMDYHIEHHMFAGVPCYNLKRLRREIAPDLPVRPSVRGAWRGMRYAWTRQQTDPSFALDVPLPATANPPALSQDAVTWSAVGGSELAASIGALDPADEDLGAA